MCSTIDLILVDNTVLLTLVFLCLVSYLPFPPYYSSISSCSHLYSLLSSFLPLSPPFFSQAAAYRFSPNLIYRTTVPGLD